jgi:hypothetical protein
MTIFAPVSVPTPYIFEISLDKRGLWRVRDEGGLVGGVFLKQQDAVRFALFEASGDLSHVRVLSAANAGPRRPSAARRRGR